MLKHYLHFESQLHLGLHAAEEYFKDAIDEGIFEYLLVLGSLEEGIEAIIDDSRQIGVLKEGYLVDEVHLIVCLLGAVAAHGDILEDPREVWLGYCLKEVFLLVLVVVLDVEDIVGRRVL